MNRVRNIPGAPEPATLAQGQAAVYVLYPRALADALAALGEALSAIGEAWELRTWGLS